MAKLEVKLNEQQEKRIKEITEKTGWTKSELIRFLIMHYPNVPSREDVKKLTRELAMVGNNLNQIAKALNKHNIESKELAETFKKAIVEVYKLMNKLESFKK